MSATLPVSQTTTKEPILVISDILQSEMGLRAEQVVLKYEKNFIPKDEREYISLCYLGPAQIVGNVNEIDQTDPANPIETQTVAFLYAIQIDILSFGPGARLRFPEIPMALGSIFAQQQAELYQISIARQPSDPIDVSSLEASKILNRFTTMIAVNGISKKTKANNALVAPTAELTFDAETFTPTPPENPYVN